MKLRWIAFALLCALLTVGAISFNSASLQPKKKKILVVSHTAGFRHSSIPTGEKTLTEIAEKSGQFTVEFCRTAEDVKAMLTPEYLNANGFDGVFFNNTTGNLGIPDLKAFLKWIESGKAFMGAHAATDTYKTSDLGGDRSFVEMIGGEFRTHGAQCEVDAIVDDPKHPATQHFGSSYKVFDEIYILNHSSRDRVRVLLSLDKYPNDKSPSAGQPGDHLLSWCKMYGKGKVFYTALGHREDVWESEPYRQHLLGGIRWALGLAKGDATPGNRQPARP